MEFLIITNKKTPYRNFMFFVIVFMIIFLSGTNQQSSTGINISKEDDVISALVRKFKNKEKCLRNPYTFKMLFTYKKADIQYDTNHVLNKLTYKNLVLTNYQLITFLSPNPYSSDPDEFFDSASYIYTFTYNQIHLPCLNRSLVCSHSQLVREYQILYPEIDFAIPKIILDHFNDARVASSNCLVVFTDPFLKLDSTAWICHDDIGVLSKFQDQLSQKIRVTNKQYDFFAYYIQNNNTKTPGVVELQSDKMMFIRKDRKILLDLEYENIKPYVRSMYTRESLPWTGSTPQKPEEARCFVIERKDKAKLPEYFCIYYGRTDIGMRKMLSLDEARWAADAYANKINLRLQKSLLNNSINTIARLKTPAMDLDDTLLVSIKNQVRNDYFLGRHQLIIDIKTKKLLLKSFDKEIESLKKRVTAKACNSILICIKAIEYSLEKGLLPLSGKKERIAMDEQNPYNSLIPRTFLKIPFPNAGTIGHELVEKILKLKPGKTYIEPIPESLSGEIPNITSIKKAYNTFESLRMKTVFFNSVEQLGNNCRTNIRLNSNHLRRKVGLLFYMGDYDPFFRSMSALRDSQFFDGS